MWEYVFVDNQTWIVSNEALYGYRTEVWKTIWEVDSGLLVQLFEADYADKALAPVADYGKSV